MYVSFFACVCVCWLRQQFEFVHIWELVVAYDPWLGPAVIGTSQLDNNVGMAIQHRRIPSLLLSCHGDGNLRRTGSKWKHLCEGIQVYNWAIFTRSVGTGNHFMRRALVRAMTEARSAPVFVASTPARFGQSVWDAVGLTSCRGLFYDEQACVEFATSVDELFCKCFQV